VYALPTILLGGPVVLLLLARALLVQRGLLALRRWAPP